MEINGNHLNSCLLNSKGKAIPKGFQEVEAPRFQDNRHMKVARLSALCTGHVYLFYLK